MNCPNCNSIISGSEKFCPHCGFSLIKGAGPGSTPQPASQNNIPRTGQNQQPFVYNYTGDQDDNQFHSFEQSNKRKKKKKKRYLPVIPAVIGILVIIGVLSSIFSGSEGDRTSGSEEISAKDSVQDSEQAEEQSSEQAENTEISNKADTNEAMFVDPQVTEKEDTDESWRGPDKIDYSIPQADFEAGGYAYATLGDLDRYIVNMTGQNIYTVIQIDEVRNDCIQANISDGFMYQTFETIYDYTAYFKEGDTVAIFGTVGETESLLGATWTHIRNCQVFAYGEAAEVYKKDSTDESLAPFLTLTEAVANSEGKNNISEDEFKSLCQYYSYEDILRNPDSYKKKYAVLSGTVDQTIDGAFGLYTSVFITDDYGNKWACTIVYSEGQSRILQGDYLTVYGILNGTTTATTLLGQQVSMPSIDIQYIN